MEQDLRDDSASRGKKLDRHYETIKPRSHFFVDCTRVRRIDVLLEKCGVQVHNLPGSSKSVIGKTILILFVAIVCDVPSHQTPIFFVTTKAWQLAIQGVTAINGATSRTGH